ncbi:MAG: flavin reductase [Rhizobiales bacterium]|nr:flavin reductase [Hyphomicrobiales bacterium]
MDGAFAALGPDHVPTCDAGSFRQAMSRLGAAVHVITTEGPAGKTGFTATAVCSVSDAPPTLLVCLNRKSDSAPVLLGNKVFCVNTLAFGEEVIADSFAGRTGLKGGDRFGNGDWLTLATGSPVLSSAVVAFDCRTIEVKSVASHYVIYGAVEAVRLGPTGEALVYHDRLYKRI